MDLPSTPASIQSSRTASATIGNKEHRNILEGDLSLKYEPRSRTVRVYISSELSDTVVEKSYLSTHTYPKLRAYCQSLGLQLVMVDLFKDVPVSIFGEEQSLPSEVKEGTSNGLMYGLESTGLLEMARREINLCQSVSPGPSFVTFLAQRYGHKSLHRCIPEEDFKLLLAAVEENSMKQLVSQWYRLDTNSTPAEYVLQSHAGMPMNKWIPIHQSLSKTTRKAAKVALGKDVTKAQHYIMSAIEEEVTHGIFNLNKDPNLCCYWFKRTFSDLFEQRPGDHALLTYTDMKTGQKGLEFDSEMQKVLNHLKEARMPAKYVGLDTTNIIDFSLKWQKNKGLDPVHTPSHDEYLSVLSDQFIDALKTKIADGFHLIQHEASDPEVLCHGAHCKKIGKEFVDRPAITSKVFEYLQGNSATPLVVHGSLGSGKTTIMAGILTMSKSGTLPKKAVVVLRFIGATSQSTNIRHLLLGICQQLSVVYNQDLSDIPGDYRSITEYMRTLLSLATAEKPLCIYLDGVDELSPNDGALGMSWLPLTLPAYVKIVLSTSSETKFSCFPVLQSLLSDHQETFVEVSPLTSTECKDLLKHSLAARKRCLTPTQEQVTMRSFLQCPSPLYLQFLLREVTSWHSYFWNSGWKPAADLKGVAEQFFRGVETKFGGVFTKHALGYISAAKHGLTEMELLDILACDDEVMQNLNQSWKPLYPLSESTEEEPSEKRLTSIPPLLWSSFNATLLPFLDYKMGIGGMLVLCWSHRLFEEVASGLYLSSVATAHARFSKLADYFGGKLNSGSGHPFTQPLKFSAEHNLYNVRKLANLPLFLTKCGRLYDLKKLLLDYDWLKAGIVSFSCPDVVADFSAVLPLVPIGRHSGTYDFKHELGLIRDALSLSVDTLNSNLHDLTAQLLGRLMLHIRDDSSLQCRPILKQIVLKAVEDNYPPITPLQPLFHSPGGPLLVTMEGHRDLVSCVASTITRGHANEDGLSMTVISSSWDRSLKTWDIKSTGVLKTFDGHTDKVLSVALSENSQYAVSGSADKTIRHWLVSTAECLCVMKGHKGSVNALILTSDGFKTISASSDTTIKVWNTDNSSETYGQLIFTIKEQKSPVVCLSLSNDTWLASGAKSGTTIITNIISGEVCRSFKDSDGTVTALATTQLERCNYLVSGTENGTLRVRNIDSMTTLHILQPPGNIERGGVLTVAARLKIVASYQDRCVCVWDMITGSHLFELGGHSIASVVHSCTLADNGSLAITGGDDHSIRIWDLQRSTEMETVPQHNGDVTSVVISSCGKFGVSAGCDGVVVIYELIGMKVINTIKGHTKQISQVLALRDSQHLLTSSLDGTINLWDGEMGKALKTFFCHEEIATCIAITMDAELLLTGGDTGTISFWSMKSGEKLKTFPNHSSSVVSVAFVKGSNFCFFVSAAQDGQICVRDFHTAKVLLRTQPNGETLLCTSVSPNSKVIALGLENCTCHVLRLPDGKLLSVLRGHKQPVTSVKVLHNKNQCLTASLDHTIRLFDVQSSECITVFRTDLPITSVDIDRTGEVILYGTKGGWISTAFNQQNRISPLLKELKDGPSSSVSSFQTSTGSQDSIDSDYENLCTSVDEFNTQTCDRREDVDTEATDSEPDSTEAERRVPSQTTTPQEEVDFPERSLDVNVDIENHGDVVDSSSTNNIERQSMESKTVKLVQEDRGGVIGFQQIPSVEDETREPRELPVTIPGNTNSTACSIL